MAFREIRRRLLAGKWRVAAVIQLHPRLWSRSRDRLWLRFSVHVHGAIDVIGFGAGGGETHSSENHGQKDQLGFHDKILANVSGTDNTLSPVGSVIEGSQSLLGRVILASPGDDVALFTVFEYHGSRPGNKRLLKVLVARLKLAQLQGAASCSERFAVEVELPAALSLLLFTHCLPISGKTGAFAGNKLSPSLTPG